MTVVQFVEETVLLVPMSALTTLRTGSDGVRIGRTKIYLVTKKIYGLFYLLSGMRRCKMLLCKTSCYNSHMPN